MLIFCLLLLSWKRGGSCTQNDVNMHKMRNVNYIIDFLEDINQFKAFKQMISKENIDIQVNFINNPFLLLEIYQ